MGILMAAAVIFLFLRHVKSTLIVLVSIPLCILVSVMFLQWNGISINLMSLFGMTVAIGRVVDDSIVVVENIYRRFQTEPRSNRTIIQAVSEVAGAITSSTLATVAVFLPIAFVSGILGDFFKPFAAAVAWALLASLLVAVTVVPLLAGLTMGRDTDQRHRESRLGKLYPKLLGWALVHKGKTMAIALMLFGGSLGLALQLPSGFLPELNTNLLFIKLNLPAGTALDQDEPPIEKKPAPVAHPVVVQEAKVEPFSSRQTFIGTVTAEASGSVVPQVTGTISSLFVKKGDAVIKGQVIGEIDPTQKLLELKEAETRLAEARARLTQAEAVRTADESRAPDALSRQALENARETYERVKKLVEAGAPPRDRQSSPGGGWRPGFSAGRDCRDHFPGSRRGDHPGRGGPPAGVIQRKERPGVDSRIGTGYRILS